MALPVSKAVSDRLVTLTITAVAAQVPGDVMLAYADRPGVVVGTKNIAIGDPCTIAIDGVYEINCATGTTASAGAKAFFNTVTKLIVTAAGSDIIKCGYFAKAKTSGQLVATVHLERHDEIA